MFLMTTCRNLQGLIRSTFLFVRVFSAASLAIAIAPSVAQTGGLEYRPTYPNYLPDLMISQCMGGLRSHPNAVYALSPLEVGFCSYGPASLADHRAHTLRLCNQQVPRQLRDVASCSIVVENGREVAREMLRLHRNDLRNPVEIEVYDGVTRSSERFSGHLIVGRYIRSGQREGRLVVSGGNELCRGTLDDRLRFEAVCFRGAFRYSGRAPLESGVFFLQGRPIPIIEMTVRNRSSFIRARTVVSVGARVYEEER